jgi:glutathione S-transferase
LVAEQPNLAAYVARAEQRPAFQRALADQIAVFKQHQPEGVAA